MPAWRQARRSFLDVKDLGAVVFWFPNGRREDDVIPSPPLATDGYSILPHLSNLDEEFFISHLMLCKNVNVPVFDSQGTFVKLDLFCNLKTCRLKVASACCSCRQCNRIAHFPPAGRHVECAVRHANHS